jgi:hypothetical protein
MPLLKSSAHFRPDMQTDHTPAIVGLKFSFTPNLNCTDTVRLLQTRTETGTASCEEARLPAVGDQVGSARL